MKIYVGNATTQIFDLQFRVPESSSIRRQPIPMGGQVELNAPSAREGFNQIQADSVIQQLGVYNMISVEEINRAGKNFAGLCYSIDKPIKSDKIQQLMMHNTQCLVILGKQLRENAAIVENDLLANQARNNDLGLRNTEISVQEEDGDLAEGFRQEHANGTGGRKSRRRTR